MDILEFFKVCAYYNGQAPDYLDGLIKHYYSVVAIAIILFFINVIFYIRWWFVQSALFDMSDDLREIKEYLVKDILDSVDEDNLAKPSLTTKEEIEFDNELENQSKITPEKSVKLSNALNKQLPKWELIVLLSIGILFIFAILYINIFV